MTKAYDAIIFDLDGTLWDATASCARSWNAGLEQAGIEQRVSQHDIKRVTGRPFTECIATIFGDSDTIDQESLCALITEHEQRGLLENGVFLYEGLIAGLETLAGHYPLFIVSNCQSWYLQNFLAYSQTRHLFTAQTCHGDAGLSKGKMIATIMQAHQLSRPVYVGDTAGDEAAAAEAGVDFGFAEYGYGEVSRANLSFTSFQDLVDTMTPASSARSNQAAP